MILIDSSGWIEIFTGGPRAPDLRVWVDEAEEIAVPTIVLYEVYKISRRESSERDARWAVAQLKTYTVVPLDDELALNAADYSLDHGLAMADAVVYATARHHSALLITMDADFAGLDGAEVVAGE